MTISQMNKMLLLVILMSAMISSITTSKFGRTRGMSGSRKYVVAHKSSARLKVDLPLDRH
jgi:hypothetical protein